MKELNIDCKCIKSEKGFVLQITWNVTYKLKASSHANLFDEMSNHCKGGDIDTLYLPKKVTCITLFEEDGAEGPDKLSVLCLYNDPDNKDILLVEKSFPSLSKLKDLGWIPFSYSDGNVRLKGESGKLYVSNYLSAHREIRAKSYKVGDSSLLLKLACGVIKESEIEKTILKPSIRATELRGSTEHVDERKDLKEEKQKQKNEITERDRILHEIHERGNDPLRFFPFTEARKAFVDAKKLLSDHCEANPDTRGKNVSLFTPAAELKVATSNKNGD